MRRRKALGGPDVTPLVDVLFMLVVFLVLAASFAREAFEVDLPEGKASLSPTEVDVLAVRSDGSLLLNGRPISEEELKASAIDPRRPVRVDADGGAPYGLVVRAMGLLRERGVSSFYLAVEGTKRR